MHQQTEFIRVATLSDAPSSVPDAMCVYRLSVAGSGCSYVGATKNLQQRIRGHKRNFVLGTQPPFLQRMYIESGGFENIKVEILEYINSPRDLHDRENDWIGRLKPKCNSCRPHVKWIDGRVRLDVAPDVQSPFITFTPEQLERELTIACGRGVIVGVSRFAYTEEGVQVVGNRAHPLSQAISEIEQEYCLSAK